MPALFGTVGGYAIMAIIICILFRLQFNAENKIHDLLAERTQYLPKKEVDLNWARPEVLFRRKERKRTIVKRRRSFSGMSFLQRGGKMEEEEDDGTDTKPRYVNLLHLPLHLCHSAYSGMQLPEEKAHSLLPGLDKFAGRIS